MQQKVHYNFFVFTEEGFIGFTVKKDDCNFAQGPILSAVCG